jgi:transposase
MRVELIELAMDDLEALLQRAKGTLSQEDHQTFKHLVDSYLYVLDLVEDKQTTIKRLRKILFGAITEKTRNVRKDAKPDAEESASDEGEATEPSAGEDQEQTEPSSSDKGEPKRRGHGRNGADAYDGAEKICVSHETLQAGAACPCCQSGKVYEQSRPRVIVRLRGQAPVQAKVYELQKLRCHLCGKLFTAEAPEGVGSEKYDATTGSIIALLRYGNGMAFNRLQKLQGGMGIPLPSSTQWDIVNQTATLIDPVYKHLVQEAAQGQILHNDDTSMRVLELMGKRAREKAVSEDPAQRSGIFTSGIVSIGEDRKIALFFTGNQHAGENLQQVLARRVTERGPPIQMCDALSRNMPKELQVIVANCLAHGRRRFVELADVFPQPCLHVLEELKKVYAVDARARQQILSPDERLRLHQVESKLVMEQLHDWLNDQIEGKHVEPNSLLGEAIGYMLNHWKKLTLFLREPGAPLDNNICERALKKAILHRKNSLFYKSRRGAYVGDLFMSLIHTCQLCGADPFDYLTEVQRHAEQATHDPAAWMPWNYRAQLSPNASG